MLTLSNGIYSTLFNNKEYMLKKIYQRVLLQLRWV